MKLDRSHRDTARPCAFAHLALGKCLYRVGRAALARRILGVGTYIIATRRREERFGLLPAMPRLRHQRILDYFRVRPITLLFAPRQYSACSRRGRSPCAARMLAYPELAMSGGACLGRLRGHHHEPSPDSDASPQRVLLPRIFRSRHVADRSRRQVGGEAVAGTAERFDVFARIPIGLFRRALFRRPSSWRRCCTTGCATCCRCWGVRPLHERAPLQTALFQPVFLAKFGINV